MVGIGFTKLNHPSISLTKIVNGCPFLFALLKFVGFILNGSPSSF